MADKKDYTALTAEDLLTELKKIRQKEFTSGIFAGFLIGIMIYGLAKHGFGLIYTLIPIILISINYRYSKVLKETRREIQSETHKRAK